MNSWRLSLNSEFVGMLTIARQREESSPTWNATVCNIAHWILSENTASYNLLDIVSFNIGTL